MSNRTPMSSLAEICSRTGRVPYYESVSSVGEAHQPWFVYSCSTGTNSCRGEGASKQAAKHQAASGVLRQLLASEGATDSADFLTTFDTVDDDDPALQNPIGRLQEVSQKNQWLPPTYEIYQPNSQTHDFVCVVKMANMEEQGIGRSKKAAKKIAAKNLLKAVLNHPDILPEDMQQLSTRSGSRSGPYSAPSALDDEDARVMEDIVESHDTQTRLNNPSGAVAASLRAIPDTDVLDEDYVVQLRALAEEQKWVIQYHELPSPSDELHLMLVEISKVKPRNIVYYGEGQTIETCKNRAAKNTLEYIRKRIMPQCVS